MKLFTFLSLSFIASVSFASTEKPAKAAMCEACHGVGGGAPIMDTYPKINGQNKGYLVSAINDYKNGKRTGALSAVMAAQSMSLTDEEIEAIATYYAAQP